MPVLLDEYYMFIHCFSVNGHGLGSFPVSRLCLGVRIAGRGDNL